MPVFNYLSANQSEPVSDYIHYLHCKEYINDLYEKRFIDHQDKTIMEISNYSNIKKFCNHQKEWLTFTRDIPLTYFNFIGGDIEKLMICLNEDISEYKASLSHPIYPSVAYERPMACVYRTIDIPTGYDEKAAIGYLQDISDSTRKRLFLDLYPLKLIEIQPHNDLIKYLYTPELKVFKDRIHIMNVRKHAIWFKCIR